jgi:CheY-like chemotaxis protein
VRVRTSASGRAAAVEVADSGAGIPGPILDKIFDPFFTTREVGQGKGLGLSVAYGIARAHGGSIEARNVETGGAAVTLRVPLAGAREDEEAAGRGSPEAAPARSGARILVVDDEPVVCDLISDALGAAHRVETAPNGREGLARAARGAYDVILLDMKMPDMTGRQMFEALAALNPAVADRVIFTTGDTVHEETRRFLGTVANPCLAKPFSLEALAEAVERILAAARPA